MLAYCEYRIPVPPIGGIEQGISNEEVILSHSLFVIRYSAAKKSRLLVIIEIYLLSAGSGLMPESYRNSEML